MATRKKKPRAVARAVERGKGAAVRKTGRRGKNTAAPKAASARKPARGRITDVERRWLQYWECRNELEAALEAVQAAEANLTQARTKERTCRTEFESTKNELKSLLEVHPAASAPSAPTTALTPVRPSPSRPAAAASRGEEPVAGPG